MPLIIAVLLGISALGIVLAPLYAARRLALEPDGVPSSSLAERERAAKAALQDVEFDYQLGNLADDDYRALRERYTRRALAALKSRYEHERALDDAIEAQVRALRASGRDGGRARGLTAPTTTQRTGASRQAQPAPDRPRPGRSSPPRRGTSGRGKRGRGRA